MLTIYGSDLSSPANKVRFTANYLGIEYKYHFMNLREGEHKQEWFLKINPVGKIPAMSEGDFNLFESGAICKYLCSKAKSNLYPADFQQRAIVDQWIDFSTLHIAVNLSKLTFNRVFAPRMNRPVSQESISDGETFLSQQLPVIEKQLSAHQYLCGGQITLADITLLSALDPSEISGVDLTKYPSISKWRNNLKSQTFYTKCFNEYGEMLKQPAGK